jgi:hypothetical protein
LRTCLCGTDNDQTPGRGCGVRDPSRRQDRFREIVRGGLRAVSVARHVPLVVTHVGTGVPAELVLARLRHHEPGVTAQAEQQGRDAAADRRAGNTGPDRVDGACCLEAEHGVRGQRDVLEVAGPQGEIGVVSSLDGRYARPLLTSGPVQGVAYCPRECVRQAQRGTA